MNHARHRTKLFAAVTVWLGLFLAAGAVRAESPGPESAGSDVAGPEAIQAQADRLVSDRLASLVEEEWQTRLAEFPLLATGTGSRLGIDRLSRNGVADQERRAEIDRDLLSRLDQLKVASLSDADRITYEVLRWEIEERLREFEHGGYRIPLYSDSGFHTALARLPLDVPWRTTEDVEAYLKRLEALPRVFAEYTELLTRGLETGWTLPRVILDGYDLTISSQVVETAEDSAFFKPFLDLPPSVPETERHALRERGRETVMRDAVGSYARFLSFFQERYVPGARQTVGASDMPGGDEFYAHRIRHYTTLELSADEVHKMGLDEVARIRAEMDAVIETVGFEGDFAAFLQFLRTDPRFYAETPTALLERASFLSKKMDAKLPSLFKRLPRQPYGVEPVPDYLAPKYTGGRYVPAPKDSTRGGTYWVNTYALDTRPLYVLEALTLHEAVPGHHLQTALAAELDVPPFRQRLYISAFGEGWALYAERLGLEAGFYQDPYSDFGRLTYEMWRACRLVVDTGLHAKGWSRAQAVAYLSSNTALSLHEVETEIDRYIGWPGQALSYKIGELEIRRLRAEAEQALGSAFDLRAFHDRVLGNGALPLPVLRGEIRRWIDSQR